METIVFTSLDQILGFLQCCLYTQGGEPRDYGEVSGLRSIIGQLLQLGQEEFTLEDVMTVLSNEYQIGQPRCNSDDLIPLLMAIIRLSQEMPERLEFAIKLPVGESEQVEDTVEPVDETSPELTGVWKKLAGLNDCPIKSENSDDGYAAFFSWLRHFQLTELNALDWYAVGYGPDAVHGWFKKKRLSDENPIAFLNRLIPNWNGIDKISPGDINIEPEGLRKQIANVLLPGLSIILKELSLIE